ncbi:PepSY domain-containing protein [uncultured Shimia sp.]|uniref:PepSY domain-containing protein n=1 Tax=uncultured Shimia sp. TaxID=573152 RepID=UPI00260AD460|nr:PepSY domain-containing protein [uncultured Shimia sp.]
MKRILLTSSVIALGLGVQVHAETFAQRVEAAMIADGYSDIEIELVDGKLKVEGKKDGMEVETVYLAASEEVLSQQVEEDDDNDDDNDDDQGGDEDEDDDDADDDGSDADDDDEDEDEDDDDDDGEDEDDD